MTAVLTTSIKLRYLYVATTFLCLFMICWILIFPSTALQEHVVVLNGFRELADNEPHLPPKSLTKYRGHSAVHFSHILPSALWSALIPFQLHPGFRKRHRRLHRIMGYMCMATSVIVMVGVVIIFQRGLQYTNFLDKLPKQASPTVDEMSLAIMSVWFIVTAVMALMEARRKRFVAHQTWIFRHMASGLWVAVMRLITILVGPFFRPPLYNGEVPQWVQGQIFNGAGKLGMTITVITAEYAISLLKENHKEKQL